MAAKPSTPSTTNVLVTVEETKRDRLDEVAKDLRRVGMNVAETFSVGGVIAGDVAHKDLGRLQTVDGVKAVEEEPSFFADR